jgi:formiminotetrahydrofolate cyclodeaminase
MWRADTPIDLSALAARTAAPGGGAGAAWGCALGAALAAMAARYAGREEDAARADAIGERALALGEADAESWAPVLEAQRRPADDPARDAAIAAALGAAAEVPLQIAEAAAEVAVLARALAVAGKPALRGDALAGADLAAGACRAAARLVEIDLEGAQGDPRLARARAAIAALG